MNGLFGDVQQLVQHNPWLAVGAVFFGGVATASNPCVLAMIPLMMSMVAGTSRIKGVKKSIGFSFLFVMGLSVTFTILGLISGLMGRLFGDVGSFWKYAAVAVCLVMGLHLLGILRWEIPVPRPLRVERGGGIGAFLLGLLFGVVSSPCAVPILAVLLALVAEKGRVVFGGILLFVYALGHSVLILVAGASMGAAKRLLESKGFARASLILRRSAGVVVILIGAYLLFR